LIGGTETLVLLSLFYRLKKST